REPEQAPETVEETRPAPPSPAAGSTPSALSPSAGPAGPDQGVLATLPLPARGPAGAELSYANRDFLELTGYASLAQLRREGGLGRLFVENEAGPGTQDEERKPRLRTLGGETFPVDAHLQSIRWDGGSALMLALRRAEARAPSP